MTHRYSRVISGEQLWTRRLKVSLCIVFVFTGGALFNVGRALDGFVPKLVAVGYEGAVRGTLPSNGLVEQVPGFFSFTSTLFTVLDVRPLLLLHFPIQLVPYVLGIFTLAYLVANGKVVIAGLLAGLEVFLTSSATATVYLWPHGLGFVLFYILTICLVVLFQRRTEYWVLPLILLNSAALVYISYNLTLIYLAVLVVAFVLIELSGRLPSRYAVLDSGLRTTSTRVVLLISGAFTGVLVVNSDFFWGTFVPLVKGGVREGTLAEFLATWVGGTESGSSELSHLATTPPDAIRYIAITRYALVFLGLLAFSVYLAHKLRERREIVSIDLLLASYIGALTLYFVARLYIGSVAVSLFYIPGVLSLAYLYSVSSDRRVTVSVVILLMLITGTVVATQVVNNADTSEGLIERNLILAYDIDNEQEWVDTYGPQGQEFSSSEYTRNLMTISSMVDQRTPSYGDTSERYPILQSEHAVALTRFKDPSGTSYFVLNTREESMSLQQWRIIKSWRYHREEIHANPNVDKVYTEGGTWILRG